MATTAPFISTSSQARLGPVRQTYAGTAEFPPMTRAYRDVQQVVKETGLLQRTPLVKTAVPTTRSSAGS